MNYNSFEGFVLAGGKSSRMGTDKARLEFGGETFLERAVKTLSEVCAGKVKVVLNQNQLAPENCECVRDVFTERGALGGVHAALRNCESEWAIILAVDLPFVTCEAIEKLAKAALVSDEFTAVVPRQTEGILQPLCAAYLAKRCLPPLEKLLSESDCASVRDFLTLVSTRSISSDELTANADEDLFFNVNRPADFRRLG